MSSVPDDAAQPVQLLRSPEDPRSQVSILLPRVRSRLPLCLFPDSCQGELPALLPQSRIQVCAALEDPSRWREGMGNWDLVIWKYVFLTAETKEDVAPAWCGFLHDKTHLK